MDRDLDGGGDDGRVLGRIGDELEHSEYEARGRTITHGRAAYDADADTTCR